MHRMQERTPAGTGMPAEALRQTGNRNRTRTKPADGVRVYSSARRAVNRYGNALAPILFFAAFGCIIAALVEMPEHLPHALAFIVAAAVCWVVGEVAS